MHHIKRKPLCQADVAAGGLTAKVTARCCVVNHGYVFNTDAKLIAVKPDTVRYKGSSVIAGYPACCPCSAYFSVRHSHRVTLCLGSLLRRAGRHFIQKFFSGCALHHLDGDKHGGGERDHVDGRCDCY